jgi:lipopolysaccharide biosynthesis regulator YciM
MGDAQRAAVLHRSLTVRQDIPREKRVSITLSLAEDLLAIKQWSEAGEVLDSLKTVAANSARYWRARFAHWVGMGREAAAAQALRTASHMCSEPEGKLFKEQYTYFQADRALRETRENRLGEAKRILKDIPRASSAKTKVTYVRALIAAHEGNAEKAIATATEGLLESPLEMTLFLPTLQEALLDSGQYTRSLTILESACQDESAPPSLWIALALLYEKLDRREDAIGLIERKAHDARLTPNAAAPFLKLLASEQTGSDLGRVWQSLHVPAALSTEWICHECDAKRTDIRWFCPDCFAFNSFSSERRREGKIGTPVT